MSDLDSIFTIPEILHYSRHFNLPQVGKKGQSRLRAARVLYIGAGGLGSSALLYLSAAGVGTIGIVDDDRIEISNLQRQILYSYDEIGSSKAYAAKKRLEKLNPLIQINSYDVKLTHENAIELIKNYDYVADGSDNYETHYTVNDACFHLNKAYIYSGVSQFDGQCSVFATQGGACYRCLFDEPPPSNVIPSCAEGGILGVIPGIMGNIQAIEIIKLILGIGRPLINKMLLFNALTMVFRELTLAQDPSCRLCKYKQSFETLKHHNHNVCENKYNLNHSITVEQLEYLITQKYNFLLLDVREQDEYEICNIGGRHIPFAELGKELSKLDTNIHTVVICKSGIRSMQAADVLRKNGFRKVSYLLGGILAWLNKFPTNIKIHKK